MTRSLGCLAAVMLAAATALAQDAPQQQTAQPSQPQKQAAKPAAGAPTEVTMDQLQRNPEQYVGKEITVQAAVQDVLSPRLLTIDDREPFDLDGDLLVSIQAPFAGLVSEAAQVTVTGTVRPIVKAEIDRELQWIDENTASMTVGFEKRPMIVARSITSSGGMELTVRMDPQGKPMASRSGTPEADTGAVGTAGRPAGAAGSSAGKSSTAAAPIGDASELIAAGDTKLVGRHVELSGVRVVRAADERSFWVSDGQGRDNLLVVPVDRSRVKVDEGQTVAITGVVMEMPRAWQDKFSTTQGTDEEIYVFASGVQTNR